MADIATVWHWSYTELSGMTIHELKRWHKLALDRAKLMYY